MVAELVGDGALRRQDAPVRLLRQMRPAEHLGRLLVAAGVGKRLAVGREERQVLGITDRRLLQDGDRLGVLVALAQRGGVADRGGAVAGIGLEARGPGLRVASPRLDRPGRARDVRRPPLQASAGRERDERRRRKAAQGIGS